MKRSLLLGLGLDCSDGQKRITLGKNYRLYGGSKETHQLMQEKCVKLSEEMDKRGKTLDEMSYQEFIDTAYKIGLKLPEHRRF